LSQSDEFSKFLTTMNSIEKQREFDRKVDRLKKSSSATTFWAIFPSLFGIHGIAHFYLNRPIEGLLILIGGILPGILVTLLTVMPYFSFLPLSFIPSMNGFGFSPDTFYIMTLVLIGLRVAFFIGNIYSARYQYSKYDFFIHHRAQRPWNNWGLDSQT